MTRKIAGIRYLARRAKISGTTPEDEVKCDMISEACRDLVIIACQAPFQRYRGDASVHLSFMKDKWSVFGARFEAVLQRNGGEYLVGNALTYADVLVAHVLTWFVEEVSEMCMIVYNASSASVSVKDSSPVTPFFKSHFSPSLIICPAHIYIIVFKSRSAAVTSRMVPHCSSIFRTR